MPGKNQKGKITNPTGKGGFKPGQSGNLGGRSKALKDLQDLARQQSDDAIQTLANIMNSESTPASARISAASEILSRGWGKAPQCIELNKKGEIPFRHLSGVEMRVKLLESMREFVKSRKEQGIILQMNL